MEKLITIPKELETEINESFNNDIETAIFNYIKSEYGLYKSDQIQAAIDEAVSVKNIELNNKMNSITVESK